MTFALDLPQSDPSIPIFQRIARAIAADVRRGRLSKGERLPGSRTLAETLGVHRNTVLAAYRALEAEGYLTTRSAEGTFVREELPETRARTFGTPREGVPVRVPYPVRGHWPPIPTDPFVTGRTKALVMSGGIPDLRLVPQAEIARAYRRAAKSNDGEAHGYGDPRGHVRLRGALATFLRETRGLACGADDVLVTRGSQMAIYLVARTLFAPGDVVAVEGFGYRPAWDAFVAAGAEVVPVPVDASGLVVEKLPVGKRLAAVYVTPHHQYPTTVVLSPARRLALLRLAELHRFAIIEDDYDHEFHYEGRPILPLSSVDRRGSVLYLGTLSKILAPGLRIGALVAPPQLLNELTALRRLVDRSGDGVVERAIAELVEDDLLARHARKMRRVYQARRDALSTSLERALPGALSFAVPSGGMALWATAHDVDVERWAELAQTRGVVVATGRRFAFDGRSHRAMRLGFAMLNEVEIAKAVAILARTHTEARA